MAEAMTFSDCRNAPPHDHPLLAGENATDDLFADLLLSKAANVRRRLSVALAALTMSAAEKRDELAALSVERATRTIPIVVMTEDMVAAGFTGIHLAAAVIKVIINSRMTTDFRKLFAWARFTCSVFSPAFMMRLNNGAAGISEFDSASTAPSPLPPRVKFMIASVILSYDVARPAAPGQSQSWSPHSFREARACAPRCGP